MNVFVVPSWYPSATFPSTGIFHREQSQLIARHNPDWNVGISTWGSHDPKYWIQKSRPLEALLKIFSKRTKRPVDQLLESNCVELFYPAYTWTRRFRKGNIEGIIRANEENLKRFVEVYGQPDILHAHISYPGGFVVMELSKKYNIPYVITEQMSPFPMPSFSSDWKKVVAPPLKKAHAVLAVSEALAKTLHEKCDVEAIKASNFIDDEFFVPSQRKDKNPVFTFLSVGRLDPQKDFPTLLRSVKILSEGKANFKVQIAGSGNDERALKTLARKLGINEYLAWLGECDRIEVRNYMQQADCFVLSSLHEKQPLVILEAMACGLPIITTNWSGATELVNNEIGKVTPLSNAEILGTAMGEMMSKAPTSSAIRKYFDQNHGTKKVVSDLEKIYRQVIRSSK